MSAHSHSSYSNDPGGHAERDAVLVVLRRCGIRLSTPDLVKVLKDLDERGDATVSVARLAAFIASASPGARLPVEHPQPARNAGGEPFRLVDFLFWG